jgi:alkylated DNA repair dioxygenase AlkB
MSAIQPSFLADDLPDGFAYRPGLISAAEEGDLVAGFARLDLKPFEFQGYLGNRRVVTFGLRYDFQAGALQQTAPIPDFLLPLRERAAGFAGLPPAALPHVLVTEYAPGAAIGWHRDRPVFGDVIGISFVSPCRFRLRRRAGARWQRAAVLLEPRSAYLLRGEARTVWEHSIPAGEALRYSVTFRSLKRPEG